MVVETTYININAVKSRLIQLLAVMLLAAGFILLYIFREQTGGTIIPILLVFPALGLTRLSRSFMDRVGYNPPGNEAERRLLRRFKVIRLISGIAFLTSLVVIEYRAALPRGGAFTLIGVGMVAVLCFGVFVYALAQGERFQRRP